MKILPILYNTNKYRLNNSNKTPFHNNASVIETQNIQRIDAINFYGKKFHPDANLKKLLKYGIPDMYSDVILLDPQAFQEVLQSNVFSAPLPRVTAFLGQYEKSLFPVEKQVLELLKNAASKYRNRTMEDYIHSKFPKYNEILMEEQRPVFEKLKKLSYEMPKEQKKEFDDLMALYNSKMLKKSIVVPFSIKEFRYKLGRISQSIKSRNVKKEVQTMKSLIKMTEDFIFVDEHTGRSKFLNKKIKATQKVPKDSSRYNSKVLRSMQAVLENSSLKDNKELNALFVMANAQIYGIPIKHPFKRKSFIYDLQKITAMLEDRKLANEMNKIATKLPTSKQSVAAFIVNEALNSSDKIGYDLLAGSVGTTEHLKPIKRGGQDMLNNMGLASKYKNNERAHMAFDILLKKNPEISQYCQKQADRLIELYNNGIFDLVGLSRGYILNFANVLENLSSKENPLKLDLSKLKD